MAPEISVMRFLHFCFGLSFTLFTLASCGKNDGQDNRDVALPDDTIAVHYYLLPTQGRYEDYIQAMQSCDGTTSAYQEGVKKMLKHHQETVIKNKGGVAHVETVRTELSADKYWAQVFLKVTYADSSHEEILFPLLKEKERWRIP